ncbi:MAG: hypothetical protein GQF41_1531 [Candidatus Rifleibacterium amylolyticum]|nr:MAG: hypothetical protein GQF41_1531 [Candidatus Rifleibacterium amylolyticum]
MEVTLDQVLIGWALFLTFAGSGIFRWTSPLEYKDFGTVAGIMTTFLPLSGYFVSGRVSEEPTAPLLAFAGLLIACIVGFFIGARVLDRQNQDNLAGQWMKALGLTALFAVLSVIPLGAMLMLAAHSGWTRP